MTPSLLRPFRPLFENLSALAQRRQARSAGELRPLRVELRKQLLALKNELTTRLTERESYLTLFALVVHLDEVVRTSFPEADHATWPLLQKELFDTERGGELFYQSLAELLDAQKLAPVVYQIYYLCLSLGFRGKYAQEPERRAQVMKKLRDWLVASVPVEGDVDADPLDAPPARVPRLRSRAWPYAAAATVIVTVYLLLSSLAASTAAHWRDGDAGKPPLLFGEGRRAVPLSARHEERACRSS